MLVYGMRSETRREVIILFDFSQEHVRQAALTFHHSAHALNNHKSAMSIDLGVINKC